MRIDRTNAILTLLEDAYFGTGGFEFSPDGALGTDSYLVKHDRETPKKFINRLKIAYYLNYMAPVVDSHVTPLFRKEATRTATGSVDLWDAFKEDVDGAGRSLATFMRESAFPAKRDGIHVLVVTAPKTAPKTKAEAVALKPYIYGVHALDITEIKRDKAGNITSLSHLESRDDQDEPVVRTITAAGWSVTKGKGEALESGAFEQGAFAKGRQAPVVELSPGLVVRGQKLPRSEFIGVARCCHRLFNLSSELDEVFRSQTFSILTYPAKETKGLTVGTGNVLGYDPEMKMAPAFIAPPEGPAKLLMEQFDRLVREIYRQALLTHQTGSTSKNGTQNLPSGVALRIDRESLDTSLSEFGKQLENAETRISEIWSWWTGETITYECSYPREFTLQDLATELQPLLDAWTSLASMITAMTGDAAKIFQAGMVEKIAALLFEGDETRLEEIAKELNSWLSDKSAGTGDGSGTPGGVNPGSGTPPDPNLDTGGAVA